MEVKDGTGFKTVLGDTAMEQGGRYYFQVLIKHGSLVKIGVSRKDINMEQAFCDNNNGWAIYNGELRHGSNSTGSKFGRPLTAGDHVGVLLDTIEGTLAFQVNGEDWGVAFKD